MIPCLVLSPCSSKTTDPLIKIRLGYGYAILAPRLTKRIRYKIISSPATLKVPRLKR